MGLFELWASAEVSSDLKHHEHDCHVDVLGAVGMAAGKTGYLAVFRLKYLNDLKSYREAREQFIFWTWKEILKKKKKNIRMAPQVLADEILRSWLNDLCPSCNGLKYQTMHDTTILTHKVCQQCNGSGLIVFTGGKQKVEVMTEVTEKADRIMSYVRVQIAKKLK